MRLPRFCFFLTGMILAAVPPWVRAESNSVHIRQGGGYRYIQSNGIPDHAPGQFPNAGNPNTLAAKNYTFRVPLNPVFSGRAAAYGHHLFGVALNGVPFDPATVEYWNNDRNSGWNYEALSGQINLGLDHNHAHVQPDGAYHYHGVPEKFLKANTPGQLVGYAADGFPIYYDSRVRSSYRLKQGTRPSGPRGRYDGTFVEDYKYAAGTGDLDECNGRVGATSEYPRGIYHYYLTSEFPFIPRCLKGPSDSSFKKQQGPGRDGQRPRFQGQARGPMPPREAVDACSGQKEGAPCHFQAPHGVVRGVCRNIQGVTACVS